jgi:hypothetical protein
MIRAMENDTPTTGQNGTARQDVGFDEVSSAATSLRDDGKPVTVDTVREFLGAGSPNAIYKHLAAWRAEHVKPPEPPRAEIPASIMADLVDWVRQYAEEAGAGAREALAQADADRDALLRAGEAAETELAEASGARDEALGVIADRDETIARLTAELANAKQVAMEALVGKAKDQLAIEGKDAQLADLRAQIEKNVTAQAALSDAKLAVQMELVGATTARDSLEAEVKQLRAQLEATRAKR